MVRFWRTIDDKRMREGKQHQHTKRTPEGQQDNMRGARQEEEKKKRRRRRKEEGRGGGGEEEDRTLAGIA